MCLLGMSQQAFANCSESGGSHEEAIRQVHASAKVESLKGDRILNVLETLVLLCAKSETKPAGDLEDIRQILEQQIDSKFGAGLTKCDHSTDMGRIAELQKTAQDSLSSVGARFDRVEASIKDLARNCSIGPRN